MTALVEARNNLVTHLWLTMPYGYLHNALSLAEILHTHKKIIRLCTATLKHGYLGDVTKTPIDIFNSPLSFFHSDVHSIDPLTLYINATFLTL